MYDWECDGLNWKYCSVVTRRQPYFVRPSSAPSSTVATEPSTVAVSQRATCNGSQWGDRNSLPPPPAPGGLERSLPRARSSRASQSVIVGQHLTPSVCDKSYVVLSVNNYRPCVFEFGACHHGQAIACTPAAPPPPSPSHPPPFPSIPLPCPELASVWGKEPTYMMGTCGYYNYNELECNRHYRLFNDGTKSACVHSSSTGLCTEDGTRAACPPSPPSLPEPPSPPFVQTAHPAG